MVQQVEAAEGEEHRAEERCGAAEPQPPQEPVHAGEGRHVVDDQLEVEGRAERQEAIEQLMEGMKHARLAFALQVESAEDRRRPQHVSPAAAPADTGSRIGR